MMKSHGISLPGGIGCAGDYKCDGCVDAKPRADDTGFNCKAMDLVTLNPANELETTDPAMQVQHSFPLLLIWNLCQKLEKSRKLYRSTSACTGNCVQAY